MANQTEQAAVQPTAAPGLTPPMPPLEAGTPSPGADTDHQAGKEINLPLVGECFLRIRHAATMAHLIHFNTPNDAAHRYLGEWYKDVVDDADELVEVAQGVALGARIGFPTVAFTAEQNPVTLLAGVLDWIKSNRAAMSPLSEIQSLIDIILAETHRTQFKLTGLN